MSTISAGAMLTTGFVGVASSFAAQSTSFDLIAPWIERLGSLVLLGGFIWLFFEYVTKQTEATARLAQNQEQQSALLATLVQVAQTLDARMAANEGVLRDGMARMDLQHAELRGLLRQGPGAH